MIHSGTQGCRPYTLQLSNARPFNSLQTNKIVDLSKLKAFADDKLNVTQKLKFVFGVEENIYWCNALQ